MKKELTSVLALSEVAKYNAILDLVNEITLASDLNTICKILKRNIRWTVAANTFILIKKNTISDQLEIRYTNNNEIEQKNFDTIQKPILANFFKLPESVVCLSRVELVNFKNESPNLFGINKANEMISFRDNLNSNFIVAFFNDSTNSDFESYHLKTIANVVLSNVNKVDLLLQESKQKKEIEKSLEELKTTQNLLFNQDKLERSEARYKALIQATASIVWTTNKQGEFVKIQSDWEKFTGQKFDEYNGYGWSLALHPACRNRLVEQWQNALKEGVSLLASGQLWSTKHNSYRDFDVYAVAIKNKMGEVIEWVGNVTDTTDKLYQNAKLEETVRKLQRALNTKSTFLANVSHEIRTPLNSIIGFSDLIMEEKKTDIIQNYLNKIHGNSTSLLALVNDILDFSRLDSPNIRLTEKKFIVEELIQENIDNALIEINQERVNIKLINGNIKNEQLYLDQNKLKQIVNNLLTNSVKFTPDGYIHIETKYSINNINIIIKDSGIGIDNSNIDNIFNEFEQEDLTSVKSYKGVGLGLSIVKKLLKLMNGKIECLSKKGEGSEFTVTLPINTIGEYSKELSPLSSSINLPLKVLAVDDNEDNLLLMERYFIKTKCVVDYVDNGLKSLELFKQTKYDLVFMDIQMPVMDGYETTSAMRLFEKENNRSSTFIVALSAHVNLDSINKMLESGADKHLSKPIKKSELYRFVNENFK